MMKSRSKTEQANCKKCGTPLPSTWKYKYCENCRRELIEKRRNKGLAISGIALTIGVTAKDKIIPAAKKAVPYVGKAFKGIMHGLKR